MKKLLLISLSLFILGSCSKQEPKVKLEGKRISIKPEQTSLIPDITLKETKVIIPRQIDYPDWPQIGGFADHSPLHPQLNNVTKKAWKKSIGDDLESYQSFISTPVSYNGVLYSLNTEYELIAIKAENGKKLWKLNLAPENYEDVITPGGLAVDGNKIIAALGSGDLYVINAANQKIIWHYSLQEPLRAAPVEKDGRIFINSLNNKLSVFDLETGSIIWTHKGLSEDLSIFGDASPAVSQNVVIVTYSSGEIYALDAATGGEIWSNSLSSKINSFDLSEKILDVVASPVIVGNLVYIVNYSGKLSAFDLRTGRQQWVRFVSSVNTPWIAGNSIFIVAENGILASIYRKTGQVKWVVNLNDTMHSELDEDEKVASIYTSPFLAGNRLIIASNKGYAASFSPYNGTMKNLVNLKESITVSPIVANKALYFLTDDANIIAYK